MYKNFNITESEKEQILNRLKENGYGQPTNKKIISEERHFSLEEISAHYELRAKHGNIVVLRSKNDRKYGIFNTKKGNWVHGYDPKFDEADISLYTNESEETFLLEKYQDENGNSFYILMDINTQSEHMIDMIGKIFIQSDFDKVMEGLTPVDTSNDSLPKAVGDGGYDEKYTDKVYEEDELDEQGLRPGPTPPKGKTPPPGPKLPIDPKLSVVQNIQKVERTIGRRLTPLEINKLTFDLDQMKKAPKRPSTPSVDKNDLTGDNKGEGVNLYGNEAQTVLQYSATIDKIVKRGSGFDIFVSGDYDLADKYFHWEPNAPYFQAFLKSTRKPLTWDYNGKTMTQKLHNKEFSGVLQKMIVPDESTNKAMWDFTSPMNEQSEKIGAVTDTFGTIKEIIGLPVMFFTDKEGKIPYGNKMTISKVDKDPMHSRKFRIYFKELGNEFVTFECNMKAFFMNSKRDFVYNTQLLHALSLSLCNSELSNDGKVKSVPNVKYAKNDTQGVPSQTDNQTLSESKQKPLNEGQEILKDVFKSLIK